MLTQLLRPIRGGLRSFASEQWRKMSGIRERQRWVALWGNGDYGRLGQASPESLWEPTICKSLQFMQPIAVACGGAHTLVLTGLASLSTLCACVCVPKWVMIRVMVILQFIQCHSPSHSHGASLSSCSSLVCELLPFIGFILTLTGVGSSSPLCVYVCA